MSEENNLKDNRVDQAEDCNAVITKQPEKLLLSEESVVTREPGKAYTEADTYSQDSGVVVPSGYFCVPHWCDNGEDPRWYYPWDKGQLRLCCLGCMCCCLNCWAPCILCVPSIRTISCLVDQGCWNNTCCEAMCKRGTNVPMVNDN